MSINKFIGVGNMTRDAEIRTVGQSQVAKFGLAMTEKFRKQDGTMGENTEFIDVELWNQTGVFPYLKKGQQVYVEGSLKTDTWQDQQGVQHKAVKIRALTLQLLGPKPQQQGYGPQAAPQPAPQYAPQYAAPQASAYPPQFPQQAPRYAPQGFPPQAPAYPQQPAPAPAPAPAPLPTNPDAYDPAKNDGDLPF